MARSTPAPKPRRRPRGAFLSVEIDPELRHRARLAALQRRQDLKDFVAEALATALVREPPGPAAR